MTDLEYMRLALDLAVRGTALTSPNPLVGSLIVKGDRIVGQGYYRYDELKHAEAWALEAAGSEARDATVYVNLEPCCHKGGRKRTAPCVAALIDAGVKRVVASMVDPNPEVSGRGFEQLREAGIEIETGLLEGEARRLNEKYSRFVETRRPFVLLKLGMTLDGRIASKNGDSRWITGEESRAASGKLRHEYDSIMVGARTVAIDDPLLTDRTAEPRRRPLVRVVLDAGLHTGLTSQLVRTAREAPLVIFSADAGREEPQSQCMPRETGTGLDSQREALEASGVEIVSVPLKGDLLDVRAVLDELGRREVTSVIVEGGSGVAGSLFDEGLVDKVTFFVAPKIMGGEGLAAVGGMVREISDAIRLRDLEIRRHGEDLEITGYPVR
jgi:diaminohydroxyphosphoribosylaminopyrimidine deaminase / 5-amino-6-(5-phosphoribosylamino)uracil reductase